MDTRDRIKSRIPQASTLVEMNASRTNSRSGLIPPGFATNKNTNSKQSAFATAPNVVSKAPGRTQSVSNRSSNSRSTSELSRSQSYGHRPRPGPVTRSQTALSHRTPASSVSRSHTSLDVRGDESPSQVPRKRKSDWEYDNTRIQNLEQQMGALISQMAQAGDEAAGLKQALDFYKAQVEKLDKVQADLRDEKTSLLVELEGMKNKVSTAEAALTTAQRNHEIAMEDLERRSRMEMENIRREGQKQIDDLKSLHQDEIRELQRRFDMEMENERNRRQREMKEIESQSALDAQRIRMELEQKDREIEKLQRELKRAEEDIESEKTRNRELRSSLDTASNNTVTLESSIRALKARIEFLESGKQEQSLAFERLNKQMEDAIAQANEAKEKLRKEETLRRKLHNQVQELKGNIRVFCRVRPTLSTAADSAQISFPDDGEECKEISVLGPEERNSLGVVTRKNNIFSFDRVFGPSAQNAEIFQEISQLVQSALDGYNVCIFCYGQTGSGKTHTMSSEDGMIPRAVHQIFETAKSLEEKGWMYRIEGEFVEVYNENLNDLLGRADDLDKKKHEIRHDMQRCKTTITDVTTVTFDSPEMVESVLRRANANRSVAATKANERSSRSHSVFILRLVGHNSITGESSEGTLNLVDLAGSERLSHSGATGERLKETQNINRSLSCLGDVISALGQGKEGAHIPYRNSKLTYLLQFSLGGNSKTLMFVMVSPLQAHLSETLTSLRFATKVHNTHIGTAKRIARVTN
ncbi:hypothetical protein VTN31DRAFT_699 [Thermomyces dupontii]|uniref:uncharacterized protein n=1 Tax=Talaromyces thermophilus TaxID=28565 RepID=UPI00374302F2